MTCTASPGLPQLVKKYPKLVDPLMASLLETVGQFHEEVQEAEAQKSDSGDADADAAAEGQGQLGQQQQSDATDEAADGENGDESEENEEKDGENQSSNIREAVGHSLVLLNSVVFNPPKEMDTAIYICVDMHVYKHIHVSIYMYMYIYIYIYI